MSLPGGRDWERRQAPGCHPMTPATVATKRGTRVARVIELAAGGASGEDIARAVGLSLRQVRRHLAEPQVRSQLRELADERLRQVSRLLGALGGTAAVVLAAIMNDPAAPPAARIAAAGRLLDGMIKVAEYNELADRIDALE